MENICSRQPPKLILLMPKRKMPNTVGRVETETPSSTKANMARKKYTGWCKAGSNRTMWRMMPFPRNMIVYIRQNGIDIQMCSASSPGIQQEWMLQVWTQWNYCKCHDGTSSEDTEKHRDTGNKLLVIMHQILSSWQSYWGYFLTKEMESLFLKQEHMQTTVYGR